VRWEDETLTIQVVSDVQLDTEENGCVSYRQCEATVVPPKPASSSVKTETGEGWKVSNRKVSTRDPLPISCRRPCRETMAQRAWRDMASVHGVGQDWCPVGSVISRCSRRRWGCSPMVNSSPV